MTKEQEELHNSKDRRFPSNNVARRVGAAVVAATVIGLGLNLAKNLDEKHQQNVAEEAAREAIKDGRVKGVDANTNVYLRTGVSVRTEPIVIRSQEEGRGNELYTVGRDEVLVVSNPIQIQNKDGEGYMMFTFTDGRTGYVSNEVIEQEDQDGNRYAIVVPEEQPRLPEQLNAGHLEFNEKTALFTLDGYTVGTAQTMSPEQALDHIA